MALKLNDYLSEKLSALSWVAIILVVFIHSQNQAVRFATGEMAGSQEDWVLFIENFVSKGIARISIPLFFAISGLLFYQSFEFTLDSIADKFKKRFKSLVIPYLFWSLYGLILLFVLQSIPWSRVFFTREPIIHYSFSEFLFTLLFNPIPYQLWFVRDLIMLVIFSPLIGFLTRSIKAVWLGILVFLWIMSPKSFNIFSNEALLFFSLGCALAQDQRGFLTHRFSGFTCYCLLLTWVSIVLSTTSMIAHQPNSIVLDLLNKLGILIGMLAVWSAYDYVDHAQVTKYSIAFGYTFIIFVFHEPLLTIITKGMFFVLGKTNFTSLLIYVAAPCIAILISVLLRNVWKKFFPRFYEFATGGR